jgi:GST-like protein
VHYNSGKAPYAEERYLNENRRIYGVLDRRLGEAAYLAGDDYTIVDMATWPWISRYPWQTMDLNDYPNVKRWYLDIVARPAVQRGFHVPKKVQEIPMPD